MSKAQSRPRKRDEDEMRDEYDFSKGMRGKHYRSLLQGYTIKVHKADGTTHIERVQVPKGTVILDADVRAFFQDSKSVNRTLRSLIKLIPSKRKA